jgi:putative hydrolase of HD superfamily
MMSFLITDPEVQKDRLIKICMVHDVAEAVVGDITPYDGVSKEDKRRMEEDALKTILEDIAAPDVTREIFDLWLEYEDGTSKEAQLARELDKFEMIVQANEYEEQQPGKRLERFFTSTAESFTHPEVLAWANQIRNQHNERFNSSDL